MLSDHLRAPQKPVRRSLRGTEMSAWHEGDKSIASGNFEALITD
jgi:hypothetical protein